MQSIQTGANNGPQLELNSGSNPRTQSRPEQENPEISKISKIK